MNRIEVWLLAAIASLVVGLLIVKGNNDSVTTQSRVAAHPIGDGHIQFAWQQRHPNTVWTERQVVGYLRTDARSHNALGPIWYISRPQDVTIAVAPREGAKYGAIRKAYFPSLRKQVSLGDLEDGWYRISVTVTAGAERCDDIYIQSQGRIHFPSAAEGVNLTYERLVKIGGSTPLTLPDIIASPDPDVREHQSFTLSANCETAGWTVEKLDSPAWMTGATRVWTIIRPLRFAHETTAHRS